MNAAPFRPIRIEWISYSQYRQVEANAILPGATVSRDSKPPAANSKGHRMRWVLYVLVAGLVVALAYAWVAWKE